MHYFCIFCYELFDLKHEAKSHLLDHMCNSYYCVNCETFGPCSLEHQIGERDVLEGEQDAINNWLDRFLTLQETYRKKSSVKREETCCPVCDCIELINGSSKAPKRSTTELLRQKMRNIECIPEAKDPKKLARHIRMHLRYYPFVCRECPKSPLRSCFDEMLKHVKTEHGAIRCDEEAAWKLNILTVKKLDSLIQFYIKARTGKEWYCRSEDFLESNAMKTRFDEYLPSNSEKRSQTLARNSAARSPGSTSQNTNGHQLKQLLVVVEKLPNDVYLKYMSKNLTVDFENGNSAETTMSSTAEAQGKEDDDLITLDLTKDFHVGTALSADTENKTRYYCFMDLTMCDSKEEAINHYYAKLRYYPYKCYRCCEVAVSQSEMIEHYKKTHPKEKKAEFYKNTDAKIERWVMKILSAQDDNVGSQPFRSHFHCPVCNLYVRHWSLMHNIVKDIDYNHMFKHLKYYPYECSICLDKGRQYAVSSINKRAILHLANCHSMDVRKELKVEDYFKNTGRLKDLEAFIIEYVRNSLQLQSSNNDSRGRNSSDEVMCEQDEVVDEKLMEKKFPCLFCDKTFNTFQHGHEHYSEHMRYYPIYCRACGLKFATRHTFVKHGKRHPEIEHLVQVPVSQPIIQKWMEGFLLYSDADKEYNPEFKERCFLCRKIALEISDTTPCSRDITDSALVHHVFSHLRYRPYVCTICKRSGQEFLTVDIDAEAESHLAEHTGRQMDAAHLNKVFIKEYRIRRLERLVYKTYCIQTGFCSAFSGKSEEHVESNQMQGCDNTIAEGLNTSEIQLDIKEKGVECVHCKRRLQRKQFKKHFKSEHPNLPIIIPRM